MQEKKDSESKLIKNKLYKVRLAKPLAMPLFLPDVNEVSN